MSQLATYRKQVIEKFNAGEPVTMIGFYNLLDTPVLEKMRQGLERDFDEVSTRQSRYQYARSEEWVTTRLTIINHILEGRAEQKKGEPARFTPFRINRSSLSTAGLLIIHTPFDSRMTYLASMLLLVIGFAFMSLLLPKEDKTRKNSAGRHRRRSNA